MGREVGEWFGGVFDFVFHLACAAFINRCSRNRKASGRTLREEKIALERKSLEELYHKGELQWEEDEFTVCRSFQFTPPGCHNSCGILYYMKDGKLDHAEGDPLFPYNNGRLCARCLNLTEAAYGEGRLKYPMKRAKEDRGKDKWERISWDEALDLIEEKYNELTGKYGPETVFGFVGTGRNVCFHMPWVVRNAFRSPNVFCSLFSGDSCALPRSASTGAIMGGLPEPDMGQFNESRYDHPQYEFPGTILIWGSNPLISNADAFFGAWITDCMQKGGSKLVVVDPRVNWLASRAEVYIPIRPAADGAVAMAMNTVIIEEGLYDHEFVEYWCYGFEEYAAACAEWTPERAAEIAWCDAEDIRRAARLIATNGPCAFPFAVSNDHKRNGVSAYFAMFGMLAITGNYEKPGSNVIASDPWGVGVLMAYAGGSTDGQIAPETMEKRIGYKGYPMREAGMTTVGLGDECLRTLETGKPYPLTMCWMTGTNPIANMSADAPRAYNALKKVEFTVVCDYHMTPTIQALADLVLPVAFNWERNTLRLWYTPVRATRKISEYYECKSDEEICVLVGQRMNPEFFKEKNINDDVDLLEYIITCADHPTSTWHELMDDTGYLWPEYEYGKHESGKLRPDGAVGFGTPTGRIELYSTLFAQFGFSPVPTYQEPDESPYSTPELFEEYPLVLTTGARNWEYFHSEQRDQPHMRATRPDPIVEINPKDAAKYGIENNEWVWIENGIGRCRQRAWVNDGMLEGCVSADHGWWFPEQDPEEPSFYGVFESNINNLVEQCNPGAYSFGAPYRGTLCKVYKCTDENSRITPGQQTVNGGFHELTYRGLVEPPANA